jgi:hypothetical protein
MTYKVIDEVTGKEFLSDDLVRDWDGSLRHRNNLDGRHPDLAPKKYPPERYPKIISEVVVDVYVTASAATFYGGVHDAYRLME